MGEGEKFYRRMNNSSRATITKILLNVEEAIV